MKNRVLCLALGVFLIAPAAFAQGPGPAGQPIGIAAGLQAAYNELGISEAQMVIGDGPGIEKREGSTGRPWGARVAIVDDALRPLPAGETGVQFVPMHDFGLAELPAEIDETPVDVRRKIDESLGTALGLDP